MKRLLFILLVLAISKPCFGLQISFNEKAAVTYKFVTLGDVATFSETSQLTSSLATKVVAKSPPPGESLYINSIEIKKQILRKTNLSRHTKWSGSSIIAITRKGQPISPDQLVTAIDSYLQEKQNSLPQAEISFKPKSLPLPFMLPEGKLSIEVVPSNPSILKSSRFSLIIRVDNKVRKNLSIQGKLQVLASIVITRETLKRGSILTPANTALVVKDLTEYKYPCTSLRSILGKRLKKTVRRGDVLRAADIEFPPLIKKGQLVKIIINQGNLHLTATGVARTNGMLNQMIRVQNANSNKLIYCRVTAPGIVEVTI